MTTDLGKEKSCRWILQPLRRKSVWARRAEGVDFELDLKAGLPRRFVACEEAGQVELGALPE